MIKSVLIANRGEIALRVIRTAKRLGIRTIAVYSAADRAALHARSADEAIEIGPAPSTESYLRQDRIVEAALSAGAGYVHPGCGFLAENADFAERCEQAGLVFVGPTPEAIRVMGQKDRAKRLAAGLGIPTLPGYSGEAQDDETFTREAAALGYPVLLKAVAGGGGKGLKAVSNPANLIESAASARREAQAAFGDDRLLIEKLVEPARHIEVQIFGDSHGNTVHLFERECTLQRRNQKVIEEAPAIEMPEGLRSRMTQAALAAASAVRYRGAGTVEFLLPGGPLADDVPFYFMEMNTRLQIEHPVTELITGVDLVEWQFRVAAGERLPLSQDEIAANGWAVEARLYAEDPQTGFLPSPGPIWQAHFPECEGVRIDSGVETGDTVPPYYDAMIAKIIGHGESRGVAYDRLLGALRQTILAGPKTNLAFLHALAQRAKTEAGALSTSFIEHALPELTWRDERQTEADAASALLVMLLDAQHEAERLRRIVSSEPHSPWDRNDAFEFASPRKVSYTVDANGDRRVVTVAWTPDGPQIEEKQHWKLAAANIIRTDRGVIVWRDMRQTHVCFAEHDSRLGKAASGKAMRAPMSGRLARLFVKVGEKVALGDQIAIVEAMKMEHVLHADMDGVVTSLPYGEGDQAESGAVIAELEADT